MPVAQLMSGAIEALMNGVIRLDPDAESKLEPLQGKSMQIELQELPWPLRFCFSSKIDVLVIDKQASGVEKSELKKTESLPADCCLALSLGVLPELKDASQISKLIKQEKLSLEGDIHVAQKFSQLLTHLDIDLEEILSKYVGDVAAHTVFSSVKQLAENIKNTGERIVTTIKEGAIEEKKIAAPAIAVTHFCDQVDILRSDVSRIDARITLLEQSSKPNQK